MYPGSGAPPEQAARPKGSTVLLTLLALPIRLSVLLPGLARLVLLAILLTARLAAALLVALLLLLVRLLLALVVLLLLGTAGLVVLLAHVVVVAHGVFLPSGWIAAAERPRGLKP